MFRKVDKNIISQAELRKGAEITTGTSSATRLVSELYMLALESRLTGGAVIEPGPLNFDSRVGVVCRKKMPAEKRAWRQPDIGGFQGRRSVDTAGHCYSHAVALQRAHDLQLLDSEHAVENRRMSSLRARPDHGSTAPVSGLSGPMAPMS
jgi:hypothetical protein